MSGRGLVAAIAVAFELCSLAGIVRADPDEGFTVGVSKGDCIEFLQTHGELEAISKVAIHVPEIDEYFLTVKEVLDNGTKVKKGDLVLEMDDGKFRQELETARQEFELAEAELKSGRFALEDEKIGLDLELERKRIALEKEKTMVVRDSTVISKVDLRKAELAVELAELELNQARKSRKEFDRKYEVNIKVKTLKVEEAKRKIDQANVKIAKSRITAPRDGVIYKPFVTLNNEKGRVERNKVARPGDLLLEIPSFEKFQGVCYVPSSDFKFVGVGDKVRLWLTVMPEREFSARITEKDPYPMTRNERLGQNDPEGYLKEFKVTFAIDGKDGAFRQGLTFTARIESIVAPDCLFIPRAALFENPAGGESVFVKTAQGCEMRAVKVTVRSLSHAVIAQGLFRQDRVVLAPEEVSRRSIGGEGQPGQEVSPKPTPGR
ncbi:MAG: HlyD family efflux transporter periplasmic adaptor subunit [Candidatus Wallbacteria bacterium]|nr:HlyD family efflux transporter periplasmic adaptor subunit [Candidatus Wallbacteria bacterium]